MNDYISVHYIASHTFVKGIPRPLPINRKLNRDSLICEDDDVPRDSVSVSNSKSIEETEEFKKAVETFDEIFQSESGNASPESAARRLSPNVNWKRIKTSKSFEAEENALPMSDCEMKETTSTTQKTEQHYSSSQEIVVETASGPQENIREETETKEKETYNERENGCIDDEELRETILENKKISLLGEHYSERSDTSETEEHCGIHPDIVKNVDGPARQRKGRSRPSRKQKSRSGSPGGGETEDFSQPEGRPSPSVRQGMRK